VYRLDLVSLRLVGTGINTKGGNRMADADHEVLGIVETTTVNGPMDNEPSPSEPAPLSSRLAILARNHEQADAIPDKDAKRLTAYVERLSRFQPYIGQPLIKQCRRAMTSSDTKNENLFVVPTNTGAVCYILGATAAACMDRLINDLIGWNMTYAPIPGVQSYDGVIHGLISDDVMAVTARFQGSDEPLVGRVSQNTFVIDFTDLAIDPMRLSSFELTLRSGTVIEVRADGSSDT
jgi:hypothetical protein